MKTNQKKEKKKKKEGKTQGKKKILGNKNYFKAALEPLFPHPPAALNG